MERVRRWFLLSLASLLTAAWMPPRKKRTTCSLSIASISPDGRTITVRPSAKARPGTWIASWELHWGDGTFTPGVGDVAPASHTYSVEGDIWIRIQVWDAQGGTAEATVPGRIVFSSSADDAASSGYLITPTIEAASCSFTHVNEAVTAASAGDVIGIPGGTCTWGLNEFINTPKRVSFSGVGAGTDTQCAVGGQTTYTCLTAGAANVDGLMFLVLQPAGGQRVAGITFDSGSATIPVDNGLLNIRGATPDFRFDHNKVYSRPIAGAIRFNHFVRGVVDHNEFIHSTVNAIGIYVFHGGWNSAYATAQSEGSTDGTCLGYESYSGACGDRAWADDTKLGSADFIFFEDNTFRGVDGAIYFMDGWKGTRYVVRYNEIYNTTFEIHGTDTAGRSRGGRALEFYRNNIYADGTSALSVPAVFAYRGGTGAVWQNVITTSGGGVINQICNFDHYRRLADNQCGYWYCADQTFTLTATHYNGSPAGTDWHVGQGGLGTVAANYFDFNPGSGLSYPAMDQCGRGKGDLLTGDETNGGVTPTGWPNQIRDPLYCFGNTKNGSVSNCESTDGNFIQLNRDYYRDSGVQTSSSSPFDGTTGVGFGTIANRPSTCTQYTAYFATDEGTWGSGTGKWYVCTATNTWNARYGADGANTTGLPYTYPHPLNT